MLVMYEYITNLVVVASVIGYISFNFAYFLPFLLASAGGSSGWGVVFCLYYPTASISDYIVYCITNRFVRTNKPDAAYPSCVFLCIELYLAVLE